MTMTKAEVARSRADQAPRGHGAVPPEEGMGVTILGETGNAAGTVIYASDPMVLVREDGGEACWFRRDASGAWTEMRLNPDTCRMAVARRGRGLALGRPG